MLVNPARARQVVRLLRSTSKGGLEASALDHVCRAAMQKGDLIVYRLRDRLIKPYKSASTIHGTDIVYADTM